MLEALLFLARRRDRVVSKRELLGGLGIGKTRSAEEAMRRAPAGSGLGGEIVSACDLCSTTRYSRRPASHSPRRKLAMRRPRRA